jgi:hypothetical protein
VLHVMTTIALLTSCSCVQWKKGLDSGKMTLKEGAVVKIEVSA